MKKILHIAKYYYPEIGGIEQVAKDMVEAFKFKLLQSTPYYARLMGRQNQVTR